MLEPLDLHRHRRSAGLSTLSVLVGEHTETATAWQDWASGQGRPVLLAEAPRPAPDWLRQWGRRQESFGPDLAALVGKTEYELETLLSVRRPDERPSVDETRALHALLQGDVPQASAIDPLKALIRLGTLAGCRHVPALAVAGSGDVPALSDLIRDLYRLVAAMPCWPVALFLEPQSYEVYRDEAPESRDKAWVREGVVMLSDTLDEAAIGMRLARAGVSARGFSDSIRFLSTLKPSRAMVDRFVDAAREIAARDSSPPEQAAKHDDRARSHAERLLFECLQRLPDTAGLFQLNGRLPVRFGSTALEVDLLGESCAMAVEIDGYFHFREADDYRRDRHKDLLLQENGYLVMRFLADDVVHRLEAILATISTSLSRRQLMR